MGKGDFRRWQRLLPGSSRETRSEAWPFKEEDEFIARANRSVSRLIASLFGYERR